MSEGGLFSNRSTAAPMVVQSEAQISRARGLYGAIDSFSRRRAADRITGELDAAARAYEAAMRLNQAKEGYLRAVSRMAPENMERMALEEQMKVEAEFLEREMRLAEVKLRKHMFEDEAKLKQRRLQRELLEEEMRYKEAYERLHGAPPEPKQEDSKEDKRARLKTRQDEIVDNIQELASEYLKKTEAGEVDEAVEQAHNRKNNALISELEKVDAELAAL